MSALSHAFSRAKFEILDLQRVADRILNDVQARLTGLTAEETELFDVEFVDRRTLRYPRWLRDRNKEDLRKSFGSAFDKLHPAKRPQNSLTTNYGTLGMVPKDLLDLMATIQSETTGEVAP